MEEKVLEIVAHALDLGREEVELSSRLQAELGAESLDFLDIAFSLERELRIRMPRTDILQRGSELFGDDSLVAAGRLTDFGTALVREAMPELADDLRPRMAASELRSSISPRSFVRIVERLLDAKEAQDRVCGSCAGRLVDSTTAPELVCDDCGATTPLISGDEVLLRDLVDIASRLPSSPSPVQSIGSDSAG